MDAPFTLPFKTFWKWLVTHPDCILRGGTRDAVIYDDGDLHWHLADGKEGTLMVQVIRGKRLMGELILEPERVAYVQAILVDDQEQHTFELISEDGSDAAPVYYFVLTHGYEGEESPTRGRIH